jgi:hypothetical protein
MQTGKNTKVTKVTKVVFVASWLRDFVTFVVVKENGGARQQ